MSPKYADHFEGHMPEGDPRSPLFAAGGCVWPTVPPYRWMLGSTDATGAFGQLNTNGLTFLPLSAQPGHDVFQWFASPPFFPITQGFIFKEKLPDGKGYSLLLTLRAFGSPPPIIDVYQEMVVQKCNIDQAIGAHSWPITWPGSTGSTCTLYQVEFDETQPPGGWPPP